VPRPPARASQARTVYTGVWKHPVDGPVMVRRLNIDGDGQGDTNGHGGEQRAVLVYQIQSYRHWQRHFARGDFDYGQFGENLTVDGLADDEVRIGDRYRIGEAEFEVTQPRVTCYRVGLRLGEPELPALLVSHHRPGFYMRVVAEGHVQAGDPIVKTLRPGAILDTAAPRGDFVLDPDPGPILLISAGIGVTPVLAMLHELADQDSTRDIWWIHGARGPREHPLAAEAHALLAGLPHAHEHVFYSKATPPERRRAHATHGRLSKDKLAGLGVPAGATAYVCGPAAFMADMQDALAAIGLDSARIHTELFGALPSINPGLTGPPRPAPHPPSGPAGTGPLVTFARSGLSVPFPATSRSVLELADACDVPTRWSCRTGVCHTCTTPLLSGGVSYSPDPLEPPPDGEVLVCCARPRTDLVLDM
jgi:MOSC domain-containing protein YiiM/ferredoxin